MDVPLTHFDSPPNAVSQALDATSRHTGCMVAPWRYFHHSARVGFPCARAGRLKLRVAICMWFYSTCHDGATSTALRAAS
eukprot:365680-Chlamydomonas_euryale.AAC.10